MSEFAWNDEKNGFLERTRGIGFEDVVFHIRNGDVLDVIRHPNKDRYPNQNIIVLNSWFACFLAGIQILSTTFGGFLGGSSRFLGTIPHNMLIRALSAAEVESPP